ncbi:hypothetical protein NT6N_10180 [Oceaniferula spumae]|uniref:Thioredoxin domain-containing protein n=1 Tax=Oceaniferula spumae TaxID=2979115 RepID=A0AAT9FIY3_9BACT
MKPILLALLLTSVSFAQADPTASEKKAANQEELLAKIFSDIATPEFNKSIEQARKAGVHQQALLEARFLHLVDLDDNKALADFSTELLKWRDKFDPVHSEIFGVKEDWLSVINYTQALDALQKNDSEAFKKHITEAFWLSPRHAQIYGPHIERLRLSQEMAKITLKPELSFEPQQGGAPLTLGSLMKGKKAAVLHFWSPMSQEVQQNMPDFSLTSHECQDHDIAVISVLIGSNSDILKDAEVIRAQHEATAKCTWTVDPNKSTLTSQLRITSIPTMVVVSPEGKILFNGHPSEDAFWKTLQQIAPDFKQPNKTEHPHADE